MPASPALVGEYLSDLGEGYARATLRRKVAAIARATRHAGYPLDTRHPSIRDVLRGIGRTHGGPPKRAQALAIEEVQKLVATCGDDLASLRDRALLLIAFAGALRRSELWRGRRRAYHLEAARLGVARATLQNRRRGRGCPDRYPAWQGGGDLSSSRSPGLAASRSHRAWSRVPRCHAQWHPAILSFERGSRAIDCSQTSAAGRYKGFSAGAHLASRSAGRLRDHSLSQRSAGRRNHGPQPASKFNYDAQLCPPLQTQPRQSGR